MPLYVSYTNDTKKKYLFTNILHLAILSTSVEKVKIDSSLDSQLEEVFRHNVDMPQLSALKPGDMVPIIVRLYLGQTEIKLKVIIDEKTTTRQSFSSITKVKGVQEKQQLQQPQLPKPLQKSFSSKITPQKSFSTKSE